MAAFDFLSNQTPLQLPNPMQGAVQGMTLARLAAAAAEDRAQAEERQRKLEDANAWSAAVPGLMQGKFSPEAVQAALTGAGRSAGAVNANVEAWRKAESEREGKEAQAAKHRADAYKERITLAGNMASHLANKEGYISPVEYQMFMSQLRASGVDDEIIKSIPKITEQGASSNLRSALAALGNVALDPEKQWTIASQKLKLPHDIAHTDAQTAQALSASRKADEETKYVASDARARTVTASAAAINAQTNRMQYDNPNYQHVGDAQHGFYRFAPKTGSFDAATDAQGKAVGNPAKAMAAQQALERADMVMGKIEDAFKMSGITTAGVAGLTKDIPMMPAKRLANALDMVKANIGFNELQAMRNSSPTGGALGQVAVKELDFLQASLGKLDQLTDPTALKEELNNVYKHYYNFKEALRKQGADASAAGPSPLAPSLFDKGKSEFDAKRKIVKRPEADDGWGEMRVKGGN